MYWCCTETSGTLTPASAASARVHCPAQSTTFSQAIRPWSVTTALQRAQLQLEAGDRHPLAQRDPGHARALGQGLGDVGRVGLAVGRQERGADHVVDLHQRPQRLRLPRRQQLHLQAERVRRRRLPPDLDPALGRAGEPQAAIALPARRLPGLGLQPPVEFDRVAQQLGDVGAGAQLADQPGRMPGRARGQPALLQQQHVGPAELAQMIGHRAADDAATDDDDAGGAGQVGHRASISAKLAHARSNRARFSAV